MMVNAIVAMGKRRKIGLANGLPWKNNDELKYFKATTMDGILIMGRRTYDSLGQTQLIGRKIIVVSSGKGQNDKHVFFVKTPDDALDLARFMRTGEKVWVCGGRSIYEHFLPITRKLYVSEMDYDGPANIYFPEFEKDFKKTEMKYHRIGDFNACIYERISNGR